MGQLFLPEAEVVSGTHQLVEQDALVNKPCLQPRRPLLNTIDSLERFAAEMVQLSAENLRKKKGARFG
ncbi:hypothetical protein [Synechococcus sp. 1G10]|uniref:hypothetical protein n=1 Tax=Synechococcus sp. 1G10 TaxID=2025605 RepID=UPI0011805351|nr:hypothetical protein [Synechococcus sp. 1G10]